MNACTSLHSRRVPRLSIAAAAVVALIAGCATQTPAPTATASSKTLPSSPAGRPSPTASAPPARIEAASPRSLSEWKRSAAERIHAANRALVYSGAPPNPLRAVVVVEMTVAADGQVRRADLLRVPGHAKDLGAVALRTLDAASPLPAPPRSLVAQGPIRTTETWLFRDDGHFQIRTLASAQASE